MKICPKCSTPLEDSAKFCTTCGIGFEPAFNASEPANENSQNNNYNQQPPYGQNPFFGQQPPFSCPADPFDHTNEFDPKDISENKVIAMLLYLMGIVGVFIALLSQNNSAYVAFHLRQVLKFMVCNSLIALIAVLFSWTVLVPTVCAIAFIVLMIVKIICFIDICKGKAKEPAIIKNLNFLK